MRLPMHSPGRRCGLALVVVIGALGGCADLPVPVRAPYAAAPRSFSTPWSPPPGVTTQRPRTLAGPETEIDPQTLYGLADLIDFAHRTNPETRRAWEEARAAAAQAARAEAAYYPTLFAMANGGTSRETHAAPGGTFTTEGPGVNPQLQLNWILLDFGRRHASVERGGQELLRANFAFNRKLQEVAFAVAKTYFQLSSETKYEISLMLPEAGRLAVGSHNYHTDFFGRAFQVDVEGAELLVLRGAQKLLREHQPTLFLEIHSPELARDCRNFLEGLGYKIEVVKEEADSDVDEDGKV